MKDRIRFIAHEVILQMKHEGITDKTLLQLANVLEEGWETGFHTSLLIETLRASTRKDES